MTVKELIAYLQTLPQDYQVAYRCCSDSVKMETEDIKVIHASDKKVVQHHNMPDRLRQWSLRDYSSSDYKEKGITPDFVNVVMFPGN